MRGATPASAGPSGQPVPAWPLRGSNPRERGAELSAAGASRFGREQPPRARGRGGREAAPAGQRGATPASAGPRAGGRTRSRRRGSNPRERGAESRWPARVAWAAEQPPRARGREAEGRPRRLDSGATPASAGPRERKCRPNRTAASNPRERGAEGSFKAMSFASREQPPRARGRAEGCWRVVRWVGATPASAGPSDRVAARQPLHWSNPRERGAEPPSQVPVIEAREQPPRARGRAPAVTCRPCPAGATPASAGPRPWPGSTAPRGRSNPRERGAEFPAGPERGGGKEQPPRARGREDEGVRVVAELGATPASAGPSRGATAARTARESNPRERGAEDSWRSRCRMYSEQPPRARGREGEAARGAVGLGATPASAGPSGGGSGVRCR